MRCFIRYKNLVLYRSTKWNLKTPGRELKTATAGIKGKTADNNSSSDSVVGDTHRIQAIIDNLGRKDNIENVNILRSH